MAEQPIEQDPAASAEEHGAPAAKAAGRVDDQSLSEFDQSFTDGDQTAADLDQTAADRDETASEQDQLAANRESGRGRHRRGSRDQSRP